MQRANFSILRPAALFVMAALLLGSVAYAQEDPLTREDAFSSAAHHNAEAAKRAASLPVVVAWPVEPFGVSKAGLNVGPNVRVSDPFNPAPGADLRGRSETTIATDPSGRFLLAGWNDAQGFLFAPFGPPPGLGLSGFAYSADGGKTWTDGGAPFVFPGPGGVGVVTRGDPWMDTGGPGRKTYYYANLAVFDTAPGGGMSVHTGAFKGKTFSFNRAVFIPPPAAGDFLDKESLCAGKSGQTKDWVVVATTNFEGAPVFGNGAIDAFISKDRALTFSFTRVQPTEGAPLHQGTDCSITHDGKIYVIWERGRLSPFLGQGGGVADPEIVIARSDDGGATFTPRMSVASISSGSLWPPSGFNRNTHNDFPRIAAANAGPFKDRVYVVYNDSQVANGGPMPAPLGPEDAPCGVDCGHPDLDVYLAFSDDMGVTWSTPTLVAGGADGPIQFWPVVSTDENGHVFVTYNESIEPVGTDFLNGAPPFGNKDSFVDVYLARSIDGGVTFEPRIRVTETTTNWNRNVTPTNIAPNFGDYIFHVSTPNHVYVTWADGRSGVMPEVFYARVSPGASKHEAEGVPAAFALRQNYPNPFNPATTLSFAVPAESEVELAVYDVMGRRVAVLVEGALPAGEHQVAFDARGLSSGLYLARLVTPRGGFTRTMQLVK